MRSSMRWALAPITALVLAGCGSGDGGADTAAAGKEPSTRTVAATLTDAELDGVEAVVTNAGLKGVLEGKGPYTLFAPTDASLKALGADFASEEMRAQSVALLRAHILPGALTRADIGSAIDRSTDKRVQMRTMADGLVTFTKDGDVIVATGPDGAVARFTGRESLASNGAVQPIEGALVKPAAPAA